MKDLQSLKHAKMMITIFVICLLAKSVASDNTETPTPTSIALGTQVELSLSPNIVKTLSFKIDREVIETQRLFITAQSPFNDPFQTPVVTVKSGQFYMKCSDEVNDFMGICQIQGKQLKKDRQFTVDLLCQVQCNLKVSVYISKLYDLQLGVSLWLQNRQDTPLSTILQMQIPNDATFTEYMLLASPETSQQPVQSTTLFINYGPNPQIPTNTAFRQKSQAVSGYRIGVFLSSEQLKPGDKVTILLILAPKMQINLLGKIINGNQYDLYVNEPVYDFTTPNQGRIYGLDLEKYTVEGKEFTETILIKFISYSGVPSVQIGTDKEMKNPLIKWQAVSAHSFQITPTLLKELKNPKQIYVKVTTTWTTNFYLQASVNNKPFIDIQPQVTQLFHLQPNQIKNIIFQDENFKKDLPKDGVISYKANVRLNQQSIYFLVRNCGNWGTGATFGCMIDSREQINGKQVKQSLEQIKISQQVGNNDDFILTFTYNVTDKCEYNNSTQLQYQKYYCKFHILIMNDNNSSENMKVQVTINKNNIKQWLRQGKVERGMVMQGNINYYAFQLPSIQNINRLQFYTTVIQGDVSLMVSQTIAYPTFANLKDQNNDVVYSPWGTAIINKEYLKAGFYYIAVYGSSMTDYNIGVAIQRISKQNNTNPDTPQIKQVTEVTLQRGQIQQITMPLNKKQSRFQFTTSKDKQNIVVDVNKIVGSVEFQVLDKGENRLICNSTMMRTTGDDQCDFVSAAGHKYVVNVFGTPDQTQVFTILYTTAEICDFYPWNFPMQVSVLPNQSVCLAYKLYELEDIHITLSLTPLQLILSNLSINIVFQDSEKHAKNDSSQKSIKLDKSDKVLTKTQLQGLCKSNSNNPRIQKCRFTIKINNIATVDQTKAESDVKAAVFYIAIQDFRGQNVLFEGISSRAITDKISLTKSNNYFYYITEDMKNKDIELLLSTQTQSSYQLSAIVTTNQAFIRDLNQSLYPTFNPATPVITVNTSKYLSSVFVPKQLFQSMTDIPILLVSVYGIPSQNVIETNTYIYSLMLLQGNQEIKVGETKTGTVYAESVVEYEIELGGNTIFTAIQVRSVGQGDCLKAFVIDPNAKEPVPIKNSTTFISQTGRRKIIIKTPYDFCSYQIAYTSTSSPMLSIYQDIPYKASIKNSNVAYYLYFHQSSNSFKVLQMIFSGSSYLYAESLPGGIDVDFKLMMQKNLAEFTWVGEVNGDVEVGNNSAHFCQRCYYVIAVQGSPDVESEILINPYDKPILLKQELPLRDRIQKKQKAYYEFYPKQSFILQALTLYGQISVTIKDPKNNTKQQKKGIKESVQLKVEVNSLQIKDKDKDSSFFIPQLRYLIIVEGVVDSSYFVQVKKLLDQAQVTHKIIQGMPSNFTLKSNQIFQIQFFNIINDGQINLLIQDLQYDKISKQNIQLSQKDLKFTVMRQQTDMLKTYTKSDGTYNLKMSSQYGNYALSVISQYQTTISVILAQKQVNHLPISRNLLIDKQSIFQIYSPGDSIIIQIYSCKDNIEVSGSSQLKKLMDDDDTNDNDGVVRMEHGNYGGHYVIIAQNLQGQYYISINSLQQNNKQMSFSISYHLLQKRQKQKNPYRRFGTNTQQIKYKYNRNVSADGTNVDTMQFYLPRIRNKENANDQKNKEITVTYKLYISNNSQSLQKITKCGVGAAHTLTKVQHLYVEGLVQFSIQISKIKQIIGSAQSYLVGGEATMELIKTKPNQIQQLNFIYDITQLVTNNQPQLKVQSQPGNSTKIMQIALWVVLPFTFGAVLLYFAARYLIRSFSSYPTQLMEEDQVSSKAGQSEDVLKNNNDEPKFDKRPE